MDRYYKLGDAVLCLRNWPEYPAWPFALWKLDPYKTAEAPVHILAEYDPEFPIAEEETWQVLEKTISANRYEQRLADGWNLWKQVQSDGAEMKFAISPDYCHIILMKDTTNTCGMAVMEALGFFVIPGLVNFDVLPLHAAVVEHREYLGCILLGPSGCGKTTQARLLRDHHRCLICNSDKALCYRVHDTWMVIGSPWCGTGGESVNRNVLLRMGCFVDKAESENITSPIRRDAVLKRLLPLILIPPRRQLLQKAFCLADDLIRDLLWVDAKLLPDHTAAHTLARWIGGCGE